MLKRFLAQHPTFGTKNNPRTLSYQQQSPYYWWFKFLQLNKDYLDTVKKKGVGKCAELYADLGDITKVDFKTWWQAHAHLFAEPFYTGYKMRVVTDYAQLPPLDNKNVVTLVIPLDWTQRSINKEFRKLVLSRFEKTKRGITVEKSQAKYQISSKWHCYAMECAYKVYVAKTVQGSGAWADIAIRAGLAVGKGMTEGRKGSMTSDNRKLATIVAMRYHKRALGYIKASASNTFPKKL
jgi:hypothetical protein